MSEKPEYRCDEGCRWLDQERSNANWTVCTKPALPPENIKQMVEHGGCDLWEKAPPHQGGEG